MAEPIFDLGAEFAEAFVMADGNKNWIVAESAIASGREADMSFALALEEFRLQFEFVGEANG